MAKKEVSLVFLNDDNTRNCEWTVVVEDSGSISVYKDGTLEKNSKDALRGIADYIGFNYDEGWNTRQFGSKLVDHVKEESAKDAKEEDLKDCIKITPETIIDDIYIAFTLKYPHLHIRFLTKSGQMDYLVDSSKTVAEIRRDFNQEYGKNYTTESGVISIQGDRVIEDLWDDFKKFGLPTAWVCGYVDEEAEPHGQERTLSFAESNGASLGDAEYMIAGERQIDKTGNFIDKEVKKKVTLSFWGEELEYETFTNDGEDSDFWEAYLWVDQILSIIVNDDEEDDIYAEYYDEINSSIKKLSIESVELPENVVGIRRHENKASYECEIEITGEFDPSKLRLNVAESEFIIGKEKISTDGDLLLRSITYDDKEYNLEFIESRGMGSDMIWGIDPEEDDDENESDDDEEDN